MSNKNFLAKFGDLETREKLSSENGTHEHHLYASHLPITDKIIDNGLRSPNYNAKMGALRSGKLSTEQAEKHLHNFPYEILSRYPVSKDALLNFSRNHHNAGAFGSDMVDNALHDKRTKSDRKSVTHALIGVSDFHPNVMKYLSSNIDEVHPDLHGELVDKIIKNDKHSNNAMRLVIPSINTIGSKHVDKLLDHFTMNDHTSLHNNAARYAKLSDARIQINLQHPHLAERMKQNLKMTEKQSQMVPGHMFSELDMLDQHGNFKQ